MYGTLYQVCFSTNRCNLSSERESERQCFVTSNFSARKRKTILEIFLEEEEAALKFASGLRAQKRKRTL